MTCAQCGKWANPHRAEKCMFRGVWIFLHPNICWLSWVWGNVE